MTNNDIFRQLRYIFDLKNTKVIQIFGMADVKVSNEEVNAWLTKEDDPIHKSLYDKTFASFLNGFISLKRGKKEGEQPKAEKTLTNNLILRKLKIALELQSDDILEILMLANFNLGKHELSAFFRKPTQSQYRLCKDQVLRNFLHGLQKRYRKEH